MSKAGLLSELLHEILAYGTLMGYQGIPTIVLITLRSYSNVIIVTTSATEVNVCAEVGCARYHYQCFRLIQRLVTYYAVIAYGRSNLANTLG